VNLYFVVEGRRCEPRVYKAWIRHSFPGLSLAQRLDEIQGDSFYVVAGNGYPAYERRIEAALLDIADHPVFDHLFICVDAEDLPYTERVARVEALVHANVIKFNVRDRCPCLQTHVIVQNCCIETWFLGNADMMPPEPVPPFAELVSHYDVSRYDPEEMPRLPHKALTRARFHKLYLKEMLRASGHTYSEQSPAIVKDLSYLSALRHRCATTPHLRSLHHLFEIWDRMTPPPACSP
jgi:hypothetical protein